MGDLSAHFSTKEFACPDCGRTKVSGILILALEELRTALGDAPIFVDSGYRCPEHNANVGGQSASQHLLGNAADIRVANKSLQEMFDGARSVKDFLNGGVGVYDADPPFIHVDVRGSTARWARVKGEYVGIAESGLVKL